MKTSAFCWNNNCVIITMHGKTTLKTLTNFQRCYKTRGFKATMGLFVAEIIELHVFQLRHLNVPDCYILRILKGYIRICVQTERELVWQQKTVKFQEFTIPLSSQAALLELLHVALLCMHINHLSSQPSCLYKSVIFASKQST
jgi:hypothetical protein